MLDIPDHQRFRVQIVTRNVKEALYLARVKVHGNNMIATRNYKHICYELGSDGSSRFIFLVYTGVREARDDCRNTSSRSSFACGDKNKKLHKVVVHISTTALNDEHIFFTDRLADLDASLAVGELLNNTRCELYIESNGGVALNV